MGIIFNNFKIRGIDVSSFNGLINWDKLAIKKPTFVAIRAGYGRTTDIQFKANWAGAKGKTNRLVYWYMDYYSNWYNKNSSAYGMSDANWGKSQAEYCWNLIKETKQEITDAVSDNQTTEQRLKKHWKIRN